jgi:DNA-directed RNA polymerase specialized sigma24 family protein
MSRQMTDSESLMTDELISRARAGDAGAFQKLTESHRRELHVHCYRMLGSLQDAEDTLQETLLAAWQGIKGFEGRASLRTWLYRIATNRCLNARRSASRRPAKAWDVPGVEPASDSSAKLRTRRHCAWSAARPWVKGCCWLLTK